VLLDVLGLQARQRHQEDVFFFLIDTHSALTTPYGCTKSHSDGHAEGAAAASEPAGDSKLSGWRRRLHRRRRLSLRSTRGDTRRRRRTFLSLTASWASRTTSTHGSARSLAAGPPTPSWRCIR